MESTSHTSSRARRSVVALAGGAVAVTLTVGVGQSSASATSSRATLTAKTAAKSVVLTTHRSPIGTYLRTSSGRTVYLWVADRDGTSSCYGSCATYWPPVTGTPKATAGIAGSALGTTTRKGGAKQVTYHGHPLYYFAGDKVAGQRTGQGSNGSGAKWWVVSPSGRALK